ncbi:helix-turn-helix transcriptional regulator [Cupriavidus lacunae]|uniref:DNA-binding protein n=1 Tax=Cupriavidus lacunae TaxID=2666307 RepID=A0A370NLH5_9BURK|nr:hypothetical protein [Cupriavidus lacunae]RDK06457.1 hypothetical protein DN412_31200 [Cupriavidus lacunae]
MNLPPADYLDAHDLAAIFKVTPVTILRRAKTKSHSLPPPAHLGPNFPLRWRQADVDFWLARNAP